MRHVIVFLAAIIPIVTGSGAIPQDTAGATLLPSVTLAAAGDLSSGRGNAVVVEREKRFSQRSHDDLALFRKVAEEDIAELERQRDAITPLEPSRREENLQDLLDWYYRYYDWLSGEESEAARETAELMKPHPAHGIEVERFGDMMQAESALALELKDKVSSYGDEQRRLAKLLERRRLLQAEIDDLQAQLYRIRKRDSEPSGPVSEKEKEKRDRLKKDLKVVQTELLSLPVVDEDLLKHYTVLIEQGRWEGEWLSLMEEEYPALQDVALRLSSSDARDMRALAQGYEHLAHVYNRQIARLKRMLDELDRQRSRVTPAGTLREMDRSTDLKELYDRLSQRMDARIRELKIRIGACDAEVAEIRSLLR